MTLLTFINLIRKIMMVAVLIVIWGVVAMVLFEKFPDPLLPMEYVLMPWKKLYTIPASAIEDRVSFMQGILDDSGRITNMSLVTVVVSFALLSAYLTMVSQQKQRRSRENELLRIKNREIARRNEFIRYISATIGHEFKNNVGRIKRRLDLAGGLPDDIMHRIDQNFKKLFADIEVFKKIADEREASLIDFHMVNIGQMLHEIAEQYSDLADVTVEEEEPSPDIYASSELLKTVFENIMDNAVKYRKPEHERAVIHIKIWLDIDDKRRYLAISFKDEGVGMDEQQADLCCYRGMSGGEGWGAGLYFAKYVLGLHAGKIRVGREYTSPDTGTEIIIHLPYVEETLDV